MTIFLWHVCFWNRIRSVWNRNIFSFYNAFLQLTFQFSVSNRYNDASHWQIVASIRESAWNGPRRREVGNQDHRRISLVRDSVAFGMRLFVCILQSVKMQSRMKNRLSSFRILPDNCDCRRLLMFGGHYPRLFIECLEVINEFKDVLNSCNES